MEENDALPEGEQNAFTYHGKGYHAKLICDLLHLEGAGSLAEYEKDFYQGMPVLTKNVNSLIPAADCRNQSSGFCSDHPDFGKYNGYSFETIL